MSSLFSQDATLQVSRVLQHENHIQINSENIFNCRYKSHWHFPLFSVSQHLNASRQGERPSWSTFHSWAEVSKFGRWDLGILSYTRFDSLGDFLHLNFEKTNFHVFVIISIWIKYTEIGSNVESNTNKEGNNLLWFRRKKVPVTLFDLKAEFSTQPSFDKGMLRSTILTVRSAHRDVWNKIFYGKPPCKINKMTR